MLISLRWLDELLTGADQAALDAEEVEHALTSLGLEVDNSASHGPLDGVIVAEVRAKRPHPRADRLTLVTVFDGDAEVPIVCGAPNVPGAGGKVALAVVGAALPNGMTIAEREVRGELSRGMLCSETEILIGSDGDGIIVLDESAPVGERLDAVVDTIVDTVIEIGVTPNRPDALGHVGVARDLAAKLGRTLRLPANVSAAEVDALPVDETLVDVEDGERCGRYLGYALEGLRVGPSPQRVRTRLHRVGLRPISNVVDVTNLVLMEWGQPQHAFDRDRLEGGRVVIRRAAAGEPMTTLDGTEIELRSDDLVIADATHPQALAGVMGGEHSMVDEATTRGLLEVAWFEPRHIRATARHHGFHTDSSHRFERGVDYDAGLQHAARRALFLLGRLAGARPVARAESRAAAGQGLPLRPVIPLRPARIGALLGMPVEPDRAAAILEAIEIQVERGSGDADRQDDEPWSCTPPTHRPDLHLEVDLIEEVMRFVGLEDLPARFVRSDDEVSRVLPSASERVSRRLSAAFVGAGLHETVSMVFAPEAECAAPFDVPGASAVRVSNPMRSSEDRLRTSLLPGLLRSLGHNLARHSRDVGLFEIGRVYASFGAKGGEARDDRTAEIDVTLPRERERAGVLLVDGAPTRERVARVCAALQSLAPTRTVAMPGVPPWAHPGVCAAIEMLAGTDPKTSQWVAVGWVAEVHPDVVADADYPRDVRPTYAEIMIDAMLATSLAAGAVPQHDAIPRHPSSARDLSVDVDLAIPASDVVASMIEAAASTDGPVALAPGDDSLDAVELVEDYRGAGVESGRRALLFRLHYRAADRSPTDEEVDALHASIVKAALRSLAANDAAARVR